MGAEQKLSGLGAQPGLLSVVIPTFNRTQYLPIAVAAALGQVGVEVEVIVVDDGSTDSTARTVEDAAEAWGRRFRYVWQPNSERGEARNHGLRLARGEFVAFLDSDDIWLPFHARECLDLLARDPEAIAAYGEYGLIDADGREICARVPRPLLTGDCFQRALCSKRLILHPTEVVIRRSSLDNDHPFDPDIPGAEDWVLWVRLSERGRFVHVGRPTVAMRVHPGNTFGSPGLFSRSLRLAAERVAATGIPQRLGLRRTRIMAINCVHSAYAFYLSGTTAKAWCLLRRAIRDDCGILCEPGFWTVLARLCVGQRAGRIVRSWRQKPTGARRRC